MSEIDDYQRLLRETAAWKNERVRSFEDGHIDSGEVKTLDEDRWIDVQTVRTVYDQRKNIEEALQSPLPESPVASPSPMDQESTNIVNETSLPKETVVRCRVNISAPKSEELEENSDIESDESLGLRVGVQPSGTIDSDNSNEDSIHSHIQNTPGVIPSEDDIKSTSDRNGRFGTEQESNGQHSPSNCEVSTTVVDGSGQNNPPECVFTVNPHIHEAAPLSTIPRVGQAQPANHHHHGSQTTEQVKHARKSRLSPSDGDDRPLKTLVAAERPSKSPTLKRVPLYCRRPAVEPKKDIGQPCVGRYIPNLHTQRDGCERCLYWASAEEKEKFLEQGHHLRIMMVRGGCERSCAIFPRLADEFPVRLCKKCYFDTHRKNGICKDGKEEQLLWCPPIATLSSISDVTDQKD